MTSQASPTAHDAAAGDERLRLDLSALLDGQAQAGDAQAVQRACTLWRDSGQARQDWHAWHLIGDVMRSEELAQLPSRDAAFLARLRERLADEPVVLAPAAAVPVAPAVARGWRQTWLTPAAVAAGFVAVASVLLVARTGPPPAKPVLAAAPRPGPGLGVASVAGTAPSPSPGGAGLIRDAQLDSYLRAHQAARGGLTAAVPGGGMRNVEATLGPGAVR
jgi:sigma-E factor negative regulatory protein RseA